MVPLGPDMISAIGGGSVSLDSHYRYLSGLLLGIGLGFWTAIPNIEHEGHHFRLLAAIVVVGGLWQVMVVVGRWLSRWFDVVWFDHGTGGHPSARRLAVSGLKGCVLKRIVRRVIALSFTLATSACTQAAFVAANFPTHFDNMEVVHDVSYGPLPLQKLDIYVPADSRRKNLDVIVFFYGGRWTSGAKENYRFVGAAFTDKGFIVASRNTKNIPRCVSRFLSRTVRRRWRGSMTTSPRIMEIRNGFMLPGILPEPISARCLLPMRIILRAKETAGRWLFMILPVSPAPMPLLRTKPISDTFGPPKNYPNMQVTTFIDGKQPPMLLLYGDADTTVRYANLEKLEQRIKQKGGVVYSKIYHDVDHAGLVGALSWFNPHHAPVVGDIATFFRSNDQILSK